MMTSTVLVKPREREREAGPSLPPPGRADLERLLASFWNGRSPHTLAGYKYDIEDFCVFLTRAHGLDPKASQIEVLRVFFGAGAGRGNECVLNYRADLKARGKSPSTINRRLAAIRSLVRLSRLIGMNYWSIEVEGVRQELTRDTRGPTPEVVAQLIAATEDQQPRALGIRNRAMLRLFFDLGLRCAEVVHLDLTDVDLKAAGLWVLGKGRTRKQRLTLPDPTLQAVLDWLEVRGRRPGPLLLSYSRACDKEQRLCTRGAYRVIRNLGAAAGIHLHPHMLRHSAVTEAVEAATRDGMSLDQVRDFSRHKNIQTLLTYRDRRDNKQARLASLVASSANKT